MKKRMCLILSGTIATLLGCATQAPPTPHLREGQQQEAITHLSSYIEHEMEHAHAQGVSIAIVSDQTIVWEKGFGWANRELQQPASSQTLYRTGSISKLLTDLSALQLAASGQLNLDAPVRQVLPNFAPVAPDGKAYPISPRMLMTHHSGLPRDVLKGFMSGHPSPFGDVVNALNAMGADDVPMRAFSYSNAGISVLGAVVAETAGQPFESWMRKSVLGPLEMAESNFEATPSQGKMMAQGYVKGRAETEPGLRDVPAGGLTSSVHEMSNFMRMVFANGQFKDKQILPAHWVESMLSPQNTHIPLDAGFRVGLGWMLSSLNAEAPKGLGTVAHHAGATRLFNSQMYLLPEQKIGVIVMSNEQGAHELVDRIALRALNVQLQVKLGHRTEPAHVSPWASKQREEETSHEEVSTERWAGLYSSAIGLVRISQNGSDAPQANAAGKTFTLRLREGGARSPVISLMGLIPIELDGLSQLELARQDINGVQAITAHLGEQTMLLGSRLPEMPISDVWRQRVGSYRLVNQGDDAIDIRDLKIRLEGQVLMLSYIDRDAGPDPQELILRPLSDSSAQVLSVLPDAGPRIQVIKSSGKEQLFFSGFLAERLSP